MGWGGDRGVLRENATFFVVLLFFLVYRQIGTNQQWGRASVSELTSRDIT